MITPTAAIVLGYLLGAIPFGLLIGKLNGIDIRNQGSGNIGATNLTRTLGRRWGILCFVLDFAKGAAALCIAQWLTAPASESALPLAAGAAAVAGHVWPLFLRFRGGKGVATALGVIVTVAPWVTLVAMAVWYIVFRISRYVSLASMTAAVILPVGAFLLDRQGLVTTAAHVQVFLLLIALVVIARHHENIRRLLHGSENRFRKKEKPS